MKFNVNLDTSSQVENEEDSDEPYSYRGDDTLTLEGVYAQERPDSGLYNIPDEKIVDNTVYVVVVHYTTGDTFGSTSGAVSDYDAFATYREAEALAKAIKESAFLPRASTLDTDFELVHNGKKYWKDWVGYFENFEDVTIHEVRVRTY